MVAPAQKKDANTLAILRWVADAGWATSGHIGPLLWPATRTRDVRASQVLADLVEQDLLIKRPLGPSQGSAFLLSKHGKDWLEARGEEYSDNTVGKRTKKGWTPTVYYEHDNRLLSGMAVLMGSGKYTKAHSEYYLSRKISRGKVPDILIKDESSGHWVAIEVENAKKSGSSMYVQARWLIEWNRGVNLQYQKLDLVMGPWVDRAGIMYASGSNHLARCRNAVAAALPPRRSIKILAYEMQCEKGRFTDVIKVHEEIIQSSHICDDYEYSVRCRNWQLGDEAKLTYKSATLGGPYYVTVQDDSVKFKKIWMVSVMKNGSGQVDLKYFYGVDLEVAKKHGLDMLVDCDAYMRWYEEKGHTLTIPTGKDWIRTRNIAAMF